MRPRIGLVGSILRTNIRAFRALGAPVSAVVKNNGYGWGIARLVREIDAEVEGYIVADESEFWALRMCTQLPIRLLAAIAPQHIAAVCAQGGIPNVTTTAGIAAAAAYAALAERPVCVRIGIVDAAGWAAIAPSDATAFGTLCAQGNLRLELWTHITSATRRAQLLRTFELGVSAFRSAGADVMGIDVASTAWAAPSTAAGHARLRIGAGLFGAHAGGTVATTCAIRVDAPVVDWFAPGAVGWAGYGDIAVPANRGVAVLRCGYGDGFPKKLVGHDDILSIGMQYTARLADNPSRQHVLVDDRSDLDKLADRLGVGPHEFITGLAQQT